MLGKFSFLLLLMLSVLLALSIVLLCLRALTESQPMVVIIGLLKQIIIPRLMETLPPM